VRNADLLRFVKLDRAIKDHEDAAEDLKAKRKELEAKLIENMTHAGLQRVTVDGTTVYIDRKLWAGAAEGMPALVAALREEGMEDMVTESAGAQRLSAWVREFDPDKKDSPETVVGRLPERLRGLVRVSEVFKLNCRKG
jgi:hypothetical protein